MKPTIWTAAATTCPILGQLDMARRPVADAEREEARKRAALVRLRIEADLRPFRKVRRPR